MDEKNQKIPPAGNRGQKPITIQTNGDLQREAEELIVGEELFRNIFEYASIGMALGVYDGTFARTNAAFDTMMGYEPGELIGVHRSTVTPPEDVVDNEEWYRRFFEAGLPSLTHEKRYVRKDGRVIWVDVSMSLIRDSDGNARFYIIIIRDITEHKQTEDSLKKSEQRFRALSEASLEAIVFIENGVIVDANQALSRLFGYEGEDPRGRLATDFIVPDRRAFTNERIQTRTEGPYETYGLRKDGSVFPIEVNAREFEHDGKRLRVSAVRDLTDLKTIEKQLKDYQEHLEKLVEERTNEVKESEKKYRDMFENAAEGIYQTTPEGRFLTANPALAHMYGYESPSELAQTITNIGTEIYADPERRKDFINAIERDGFVHNFEIQVRRKDGFKAYVSINARAIKDKNGKTLYFEGTNQDVTENKLAEEQLMLQRDLALKLYQIESLEEGMAFVLQTAITVSGMECGGISLKNDETGGFDLVSSVNFTNEFQKRVQHIPVGSFTWSHMMDKKSFHFRPDRNKTPTALEEGFQFVSVMPMLQGDQVVGFLATASRVLTDIPERVRIGLEFLAAESGNIIAHIQARERLQAEIFTRKEAEKALETERQSLEEANAALKVLLKNREEDKKELEERLVANVQELVMPHVKKLRTSALNPAQQTDIGLVESNLGELITPFLRTIQAFKFTPRQLEIVLLIREGKTTKEIAQILNMSKQAIDIQRYLIRKKLDLNKAKTNLQSYLKSLRQY
jgi:PAS domain S-box-containing protein